MNRILKTIAAKMLMMVFAVGCNKPDEPSNGGGNNGNNDCDVRVTTYTPQDITATTAKCGGDVIVTQGLSLTELGVCWGKEPNPTIDQFHLSTTVWNEPFVCAITNLESDTKYYVRAYALRGLEYYYGEEKEFKTVEMGGGTVADEVIKTYIPCDITATTAVCGCEMVTQMISPIKIGVCWNIESNPTINNGFVLTNKWEEPFVCTITGLEPNTMYYIRAFALTENDCYYGEELRFLTMNYEGGNNSIMGELNGLFSIGENKKVRFSQGNLQYNASINSWRFAYNQSDSIRNSNPNVPSRFSQWIDMFGWGTSGYPHGSVCYQPWGVSMNNSDYHAYGNYRLNLYDNDGKADWGYNAIINGGNQENKGWRTLTKDEWSYLFFHRNTVSGIYYSYARVNGVNGVLLLPDNWTISNYSLNNVNQQVGDYCDNIISLSQWNVLEENGAVFLPAAGGRSGNSVSGTNATGNYWSSTHSYQTDAYNMRYDCAVINTNSVYYRYCGLSVRLVQSVE